MCGGLSRWRFLPLFLALLLSASGTFSAFGQPMPSSQPPSESSPSTETQQTHSWQSLPDLLTELEREANAQAEDLKRLLEQLGQSQTEVNELSILLEQSGARLKSLQEATMNEREQARATLELAIRKGERAERAAVAWRNGALGAGVLALAGWAAFAVSMIF